MNSDNKAHQADVLNLIYKLSQQPEETADKVKAEMIKAGRESEALNAVFELAAIMRDGTHTSETKKGNNSNEARH